MRWAVVLEQRCNCRELPRRISARTRYPLERSVAVQLVHARRVPDPQAAGAVECQARDGRCNNPVRIVWNCASTQHEREDTGGWQIKDSIGDINKHSLTLEKSREESAQNNKEQQEL